MANDPKSAHLAYDRTLRDRLKIPIALFESNAAAVLGALVARVAGAIWSLLVPAPLKTLLSKTFRQAMFARLKRQFRLTEDQTLAEEEGRSRSFLSFPHVVDEVVETIDGTKLKTTHLSPHYDRETKKHRPGPVLLFRTPYYRRFDMPLAGLLVNKGVHVIMQDVRGRFDSEGKPSLGENERSDTGATLRWISRQEWFDGRCFFTGISIGGYAAYASAASLLEGRHGEGDGVAKPIRLCGLIPLLSSSDILRRGMFVKLKSGMRDPIMRLDLASRYTDFMNLLQNPKQAFGSSLLWVISTILYHVAWEMTNDWKKRQMHLPLGELDYVVAEGDLRVPRIPLFVEPEAEFWGKVSMNHVPKMMGDWRGIPHSDGNTSPPPYLMASGWYDVFCNQTVDDFMEAQRSSRLAKREGRVGNDHIYLVMGPWDHYGGHEYFPYLMRRVFQVMDHVFPDLNVHIRHPVPLSEVPKVTVYCMGAGGHFRHRVPFLQRLFGTIHSGDLFSWGSASHPRFRGALHDVWDAGFDEHHAWRFYDEWPPRFAKACRFGFSSFGRLVPLFEFLEGATKPQISAKIVRGSDAFTWDPAAPTPSLGGPLFDALKAGACDNREIERRADTLVFTSHPRGRRDGRPFEVTGNVRAKMWLFSTCVSADLYMRLTVVDPKTDESLSMCEGIERRTLDVKKGEAWPQLVEVDLGHICFEVPAGWRVRLTICGGSFPQYSRNLGYGEDILTATRMTKAVNRISFIENGVPSELILPVVIPFAPGETLPTESPIVETAEATRMEEEVNVREFFECDG